MLRRMSAHTAMQSKTPYKKFHRSSGFTVFELMLVVVFVAAGAVLIYLYVNPNEYKQRARDNKRFSDIMILDRVINEYRMDNEVYPDTAGVIRYSNVRTNEDVGVDISVSGWISADFSGYTSKLPVDPVNEGSLIYSYTNDGMSYEINVPVEALVEKATTDGGNSDTMYELGNNLELL